MGRKDYGENMIKDYVKRQYMELWDKLIKNKY